jgi:hypothetical protein
LEQAICQISPRRRRPDTYWNGQGNGGNQLIIYGAATSFDRTSSNRDTKNRANVQMDTRMQTAYDTLRTFTSLHFTNGSVTTRST